MIWRLLSVMIVLFWAVMTGLIIRDSYFPDHSRFAEVPVSLVFDLFLEEAAAFNNSLHLYQGDQKMGHTHFALRKLPQGSQAPRYALVATGAVKLPATAAAVEAGFRLRGELSPNGHWHAFELEVTSAEADTEAEIHWREGERLPRMQVRKAGQVIMDTDRAMALLESPASAAWMQSMMPASLPSLRDGGMTLRAREGRLDLAGKKRRCYVVSSSLMQGYEAQLYFTELGELARIELPGGYRLIEPMLHGLEPGLKTTSF